jgi:lantibiotic modifying enzyme
MGRSGILLLRYRLAPDDATADAIAASVAANATHPSLELLWGSPGTMHVALTMHEWTGEARWAALFRADADALERAFRPSEEAPCRIWTQDLYGQRVNYIGAGHGFAGNASALIRGRKLLPTASSATWQDAIVETAHATASREGALVNWAARLASPATPPKMLVQWCHGAPGIVTSLAGLPDPRLDDLLVAAGDLTWVAGPLTKGGGLCHGTAGNGYAFLKIFKRTGDERWLDRARAFAMHAIAQGDRHATEHGQRRYSLWTGDPGVAWYLWSCITGDDALPNLDPLVS